MIGPISDLHENFTIYVSLDKISVPVKFLKLSRSGVHIRIQIRFSLVGRGMRALAALVGHSNNTVWS